MDLRLLYFEIFMPIFMIDFSKASAIFLFGKLRFDSQLFHVKF